MVLALCMSSIGATYLYAVLWIYLETLETQRLMTTVSFTGLTWCRFLFSILYCYVISNAIINRKLNCGQTVYSDVTLTLVIFNKTYSIWTFESVWIQTVIVDGQTSYPSEKTQNVLEIFVYNCSQQKRFFADVTLKSSMAHYRLMAFWLFCDICVFKTAS